MPRVWLLTLTTGSILAAGCKAADPCETFVKAFHSVPIPEAQHPAIEDFQGPWPQGTHPLEAGYAKTCKIGQMAKITVMCPNAKSYPLIPRAPVIASDPEGFTVVMISDQDHEQLKDKTETFLFYGRC